jgi:hypothetical protein
VNTIGAFDRHADGTLTPMPGSPFAAGGVGTGKAIASQGALQLSGGGRSGSHLRPLPGSTVARPDGSQPGDVLFSSDGNKLVGTRVATSLIDSFVVDGDGLLAAAAGSPFAAQGLGPFGSEFRPTNPAQLYVSNAHDGTNAGTVSAFTDSADGTLTPIGTSPFPDYQTAPCWVEISHDGQYLFTVNTGSKTISSYSITPDGSLSLLQSTPLNAAAVAPEDARLSPDGSTLWVVDPGADAISGSPSTAAASPNCRPRHTRFGRGRTRRDRRHLSDTQTSRGAAGTAGPPLEQGKSDNAKRGQLLDLIRIPGVPGGGDHRAAA